MLELWLLGPDHSGERGLMKAPIAGAFTPSLSTSESRLEAIAKAAGVSDALIQWAWSSVELREEMEEDEHIAAQLGSGVPLFVFDNAFSLSGAQPEAAFLEALNKMQEKSKVEDDAFSSQVCGIDGCKI